MFEDDPFNLVRNKREQRQEQVQKEKRNQFIEGKRMNSIKSLKAKQDQQITIQDLLKGLKGDQGQISRCLDRIESALNDDDEKKTLCLLFFTWGMLDSLVNILKEFQQMTEQNLEKVTYIISFILQLDQPAEYFMKSRATDYIELILFQSTNVKLIEYALLCLGNIDQYQNRKTAFFNNQVAPRLLNLLLGLKPLPVTCLETFSWAVDRVNHPLNYQIQMKLIQTSNSEIMFEALQKCRDWKNRPAEAIEILISMVCIEDYVQTKLIIDVICEGLSKSNITKAVLTLVEKCLFSSTKFIIISCGYRLAKEYMITANEQFFNAQIQMKLMCHMGQRDLTQCVMEYLQSLLLLGQVNFSEQFLKQFLDTLTEYHIRVLSLLLRYDFQRIKGMVRLPHKTLLQQMKDSIGQEMINQLF